MSPSLTVCLSIVSLLPVHGMDRKQRQRCIKASLWEEEGSGGCGVSRHMYASILADEGEKCAGKGCVWFILHILIST